MKLDIYGRNEEGKREIIKTYEADTFDLMWGVVTDVAQATKMDSFKSGDKTEIFKAVATLVLESAETVNSLLKDIFIGVTDEELKNVKVEDITVAIVEATAHTFAQLMKLAQLPHSKN